VISDANRRDFEDRGLRNVRLQVANANFDPDKHRQAEEWIDEQEHVFDRERNAIARSANRLLLLRCSLLWSPSLSGSGVSGADLL
jgi:hypothetical protein